MVLSNIVGTAQKMKFSIEDLFSKCDQISIFLRIWSHLLKKSVMETSLFVQCGLLIIGGQTTEKLMISFVLRFMKR